MKKIMFILLILSISALYVYSIKVQRDVYVRQGIDISMWEIFMGAQPAPGLKGNK